MFSWTSTHNRTSSFGSISSLSAAGMSEADFNGEHSTNRPNSPLLVISPNKAAAPMSLSEDSKARVDERHQSAHSGNLSYFATFLIEGKSYTVDPYFFKRDSDAIRDLLNSSPNAPISLSAATISGFESFLSIIYPLSFDGSTNLSKSDWAAVLDFSTHYGFRAVRKVATNRLYPLASSIDRIIWGHQYNLLGWLCSAYTDICTRTAPLSLEDGERLGYQDVVHIHNAREDIRAMSLQDNAAAYVAWKACCPSAPPSAEAAAERDQLKAESRDSLLEARSSVHRHTLRRDAQLMVLNQAERALKNAVATLAQAEQAHSAAEDQAAHAQSASGRPGSGSPGTPQDVSAALPSPRTTPQNQHAAPASQPRMPDMPPPGMQPGLQPNKLMQHGWPAHYYQPHPDMPDPPKGYMQHPYWMPPPHQGIPGVSATKTPVGAHQQPQPNTGTSAIVPPPRPSGPDDAGTQGNKEPGATQAATSITHVHETSKRASERIESEQTKEERRRKEHERKDAEERAAAEAAAEAKRNTKEDAKRLRREKKEAERKTKEEEEYKAKATADTARNAKEEAARHYREKKVFELKIKEQKELEEAEAKKKGQKQLMWSSSALATARMIEDIDTVPYPDDIMRPKIELNANAKEGKFCYDTDFLLQFMAVCTDKPESLPCLAAIGLEPAHQSSSFSRWPNRDGCRTSMASMGGLSMARTVSQSGYQGLDFPDISTGHWSNGGKNSEGQFGKASFAGGQRTPLPTIPQPQEEATKETHTASNQRVERVSHTNRLVFSRGQKRNECAGPDGWTTTAPRARAPPRAGDLFKFGQINKPASGAMTIGPTSIFNKSKDKHEYNSTGETMSFGPNSILDRGDMH